jgi:hypothetical protein
VLLNADRRIGLLENFQGPHRESNPGPFCGTVPQPNAPRLFSFADCRKLKLLSSDGLCGHYWFKWIHLVALNSED